MSWNQLTSLAQLDAIAAASATRPQVVFKHSTRCSISTMAHSRMDNGLGKLAPHADVWLLDLLAHRDISNAIAQRFHVHHESPQTLVIRGGECILDQSHMGVRVDEILEVLTPASV